MSQFSETTGRGGSIAGSAPTAVTVTRRVTVSPSLSRAGSVLSSSVTLSSEAAKRQPCGLWKGGSSGMGATDRSSGWEVMVSAFPPAPTKVSRCSAGPKRDEPECLGKSASLRSTTSRRRPSMRSSCQSSLASCTQSKLSPGRIVISSSVTLRS
uniref:hypothetical protein n=1 Tax=Cereibacter sphaeroides TaxID=1063 RepID=UPI002F941548